MNFFFPSYDVGRRVQNDTSVCNERRLEMSVLESIMLKAGVAADSGKR